MLKHRTGSCRAALSLVAVACSFLLSPLAFSAPDCVGGRFDRSEPFSIDEGLPFNFHKPQGWDASLSDHDKRIVRVRNPNALATDGSTAVTLEIAIGFKPVQYSKMVEKAWQQAMVVVTEIPYLDGALKIYRRPWSWIDSVRFLVPYKGRRYPASLNVENGDVCPEEARALRELFFATLTPNTDTTFARR
jgi:hypothetical protein